MGRRAVFGYALPLAQDLVMRCGPERQANTQSAEVHNSFHMLAISFKGTVMLKSVCI
jgi:hypothetical protein